MNSTEIAAAVPNPRASRDRLITDGHTNKLQINTDDISRSLQPLLDNLQNIRAYYDVQSERSSCLLIRQHLYKNMSSWHPAENYPERTKHPRRHQFTIFRRVKASIVTKTVFFVIFRRATRQILRNYI